MCFYNSCFGKAYNRANVIPFILNKYRILSLSFSLSLPLILIACHLVRRLFSNKDAGRTVERISYIVMFIVQHVNWCCCDDCAYTVVGSPQTWNRSNTKYVIYPFLSAKVFPSAACTMTNIFCSFQFFFVALFEHLHNSFWNAVLPLLTTLIGDNVTVSAGKRFSFNVVDCY